MFYIGRQHQAILSADKMEQFLHDTRQNSVRRFCRQMKSADFVVHLTSLLVDDAASLLYRQRSVTVSTWPDATSWKN